MKKLFKIRFYKAHDLDLIKFIESRCLDTNKAFYCVLKSYCKNEVFGIKLPKLSGIEERRYKSVYQRNLVLYEGKDDDIIELLTSIRPGYRNNFMKNLLRQYLCVPIVEDYFFEPKNNADRIESTFRLLQGTRRLVDISTKYSEHNEVTKQSEANNADPEISTKDASSNEIITEDNRTNSKTETIGEVNEKEAVSKDIKADENGLPVKNQLYDSKETLDNGFVNNQKTDLSGNDEINVNPDVENEDPISSDEEDLTDIFAGIIMN